jgi:hypothetical protein
MKEQERNDEQYVLSYNSNDFLYHTLNNKENKEDFCKSCTNNNNNVVECKLCDNQTFHQKLKEMQTTHSGADSRFEDINQIYNVEYLKMVNLGVGILSLSYMIYKSI